MKLHVVARGKIGRSPEAEIIARYQKRIGWEFQITELTESSKAPALSGDCRTVALDEGGDHFTSAGIAELLSGWRDDGVREVRFLIGAADGLTPDERSSANRTISFGRATWPHMLARAMLVEQLYRATSIIAGHPYHRES